MRNIIKDIIKNNPMNYSTKIKKDNELYNWVMEKTKDLNVVQSNKSLINPFELDIVLPDLKIAIEYCGLYWHSEFNGGKDKNYHRNKMLLCLDKGYRLITIFSNEWTHKKEIVKRMLTHITGNSKKTLYARKLKVSQSNYK